MTTTAYSTVLSTTNDVEFRAFVQEYHDSLVTIGLTQTSDTGQINPATVNKPTVNNTSAGYEIWRFNDTMQATSPIFLKIEYGLNVTAANQPSKVWFTIGTCNAILAELPVGTTFSTTLVGSTPHTYISVGNASNGIGFSTCVGGTATNYTTCMLWE